MNLDELKIEITRLENLISDAEQYVKQSYGLDFIAYNLQQPEQFISSFLRSDNKKFKIALIASLYGYRISDKCLSTDELKIKMLCHSNQIKLDPINYNDELIKIMIYSSGGYFTVTHILNLDIYEKYRTEENFILTVRLNRQLKKYIDQKYHSDRIDLEYLLTKNKKGEF